MKIIIGIHGLSNKPSPEILKDGWSKAMLEGLEKNSGIKLTSLNFKSIYWADVMYDNYDENADLYVPAQTFHFKRYNDGWIDSVRAYTSDKADDFIFFIKNKYMDRFVENKIEQKFIDLFRYYNNKKIEIELKERLKSELLKHKDKRVMLVAHSMGSIIAYDVLREIGKEHPLFEIEHFVTIGSPLGLPPVVSKIREKNPLVRTPSIVKQWTNLADRRDPVALDTHLGDDFEPNDFNIKVKDDLVLNEWSKIHHKSYGYLRTPEFSDLLKKFI